jgi:hypothetical protein
MTNLEPGELPTSYGKNRLVLLPVDPYLMYTYWELATDPPPTAGARAVLRFHESPSSLSMEISRPFDVDIDLGAGNWYVHLWSPDKLYQADLGLRGDDGSFVVLAHSNQVRTAPTRPAEVSPVIEEAPPHLAEPPAEEIAVPVDQIATNEVAASEIKLALEESFTSDVASGFDVAVPHEVTPSPSAAKPFESLESEIHEFAAMEPDILPPFQLRDLEHMDLTQYSEERFTPGISSESGLLGD